MIKDIEKQKRVKVLRDEINSGELDNDGIRAYLIQLENLLPEPTKTLYIDADSLIYYSAYSPSNNDSCSPIEGGTFVGVKVETDLEEAFNSLVSSVVDSCKRESLLGNMIPFIDYQLVYTPSTNFRYDIFPEYKKSRVNLEQSDELIRLKELVKPKGLIVEGFEADDVVAYYARRGHPIASGDKDVIYGVAGNNYYYHGHHQKVVKTSKADADRFVLLQTLAGDSSDDIPGISGIGLKIEHGIPKGRSVNLLPEGGTFDDVVEIYESKGLTLEDAVLTRRLVGLDQYKGKRRGLKLWKI